MHMMFRSVSVSVSVCALLALLCTVAVGVSSQGFAYKFPDCINGALANTAICDPAQTPAARVSDLLSRLSTTDKIHWLGNTVPAVNGLPAYEWWSEALHGVAQSPGVNFSGSFPFATSFPAAISSAASFDLPLIHAIGGTVGKEARAFNNAGQAGLSFFTPNVNPFRDPRWGRGQETPGEDPYLISEFMISLVRGLQEGEDPRYLQIAADCKHYVAYDLEIWKGVDRFHFDAQVSDQDFVETYLPTFEACMRDAKGASVMCSYNAMNGVPSCANSLILQTIARDAWEWDGWVVSDCDAVDTIYSAHHYTNSTQQTVKVALEAGTDLNCGGFYQSNSQSALDSGDITVALIDKALTRTFTSLIKLGWFDSPQNQVYRQYGPSAVNTPAARALALRAARESFVLLKNDAQTLPLDLTKIKSIALIGPAANATEALQGNYFGNAPFVITALSGLTSIGFNVNYAKGCDYDTQDRSGFAAAVTAVNQSDVVVFFGGLNQTVESEGNDRTSLLLPGVQLELLQSLATLASVSGKRVIVLISSGGHVDLTWPRDSAAVHALAWVGYPSQAGGQAIAEVIAGKVAPAGRLVHTVYPAEYVNQVSMFDMSLRPSSSNPGRTYKFYDKAVFEFGHGLHYTTFTFGFKHNHGDVLLSSSAVSFALCHASAPFQFQFESGGEVSVAPVLYETVLSIDELVSAHLKDRRSPIVKYRCTVTNTGNTTSDVSVLGFLSTGVSGDPIRQLFGFDRLSQLSPGASADVFLGVRAKQLQRVDEVGHEYLSAGVWYLSLNNDRTVVHTIRVTGHKQYLRQLF